MKETLGRFGFVAFMVIVLAAAAFVSYRYGIHSAHRGEDHSSANIQATLAFAHYKISERFESLLLKKCYDAALIEIQQHKNSQVVLLSDNLRTTKNDPELVEYIKLRDPKLLEIVLAGRVPELKPYTTKCP